MKSSTTELLLQDYKAKGYFTTQMNVSDLPNFEILCSVSEEKVYEKDLITLRSIYGFQDAPYFQNWLINQAKLKEWVTEILGKHVYLHQTKVNVKNRDESSVWPFHRDFPFWNVFDHIQDNKMVNAVIFLDDVKEGSGELEMIPGSHHIFLDREADNKKAEFSIEGSASSDLLFDFTPAEMNFFSEKLGIEKILGPKGTVFFFNPDVIHGSGPSLLDFSRKIMLLTFNQCANSPSMPSKRPRYLCSNETAPIAWK